jgi:hypothetical protein
MHFLRPRLHHASRPKSPRAPYEGRRDWLRRLSAVALGTGWLAGPGATRWRRPAPRARRCRWQERRAGANDGAATRAGRHHLQQLLRVRHRQGRPGAQRTRLKTRPWTVASKARCQAPHLRHRRPAEARADGRAHLPAALRRGLVDGDPLGGLVAVRADQAGGAHRQRQVRRVRDPGRPRADAGPALRGCWTGPMSRACAWTRPCTR